jgi:CelD/BcsL family acetyltransferase involved in cellulose biosynthesis
MKSQIFTTWQMLDSLKEEWNQLLQATPANTIFLTWEWMQAWRKVVGEDKRLFVIAVRDDQNKLVGIAPYYSYTICLLGLIDYTALRTLADYSTGSEYPDWIVKPENERETLQQITNTLLSARKRWDLIWMPRISGWTGAYERITTAVKEVGMLMRSRSTVFSSFSLPDSLNEFEQQFSAKSRQQLRRKKNKLLSSIGISIENCSNESDLEYFIKTLFNLHHRRRMLLDDPGCFIRRPAEAAFYRNFIPMALERGWLRLIALKEDNDIQAIQIGYAYNGDFLQLQEGFNPDFSSGAGNVLRHIVIEQCIEEGLRNYDFLGGFTEHKRRWGAQKKLGHELLIGHPSLKNRLLFLREIWPSGKYIQEIGLFDGNA